MIKFEEGRLDFSGSRVELQADLAVIIHAFLEKGVLNNDSLNKCIELAKMSDEEVKAEKKKRLDEMLNDLPNDLKQIFSLLDKIKIFNVKED